MWHAASTTDTAAILPLVVIPSLLLQRHAFGFPSMNECRVNECVKMLHCVVVVKHPIDNVVDRSFGFRTRLLCQRLIDRLQSPNRLYPHRDTSF
jgi:hypothetical protein